MNNWIRAINSYAKYVGIIGLIIFVTHLLSSLIIKYGLTSLVGISAGILCVTVLPIYFVKQYYDDVDQLMSNLEKSKEERRAKLKQETPL